LPFGPLRSADLETREHARQFYDRYLRGAHHLLCHGRPVTIVFEPGATHAYSEEPDGPEPIPPEERVVRRLPGGRTEERRFCLERARLLDQVLPAVCNYTVSVPGTGPAGRGNRMLHGPVLPSGGYLRVVLRPGPGDAWTCVTAYPVELRVYLDMRRAKSAKFPP
jgi:hypothetical protein